MFHIPAGDGQVYRFEPIDGPPTEPGQYLGVHTDRHGNVCGVAREVRIDGAGNIDHGPDSARIVWTYRVVLEPAAALPLCVCGGCGDE